MTIEKLFLVFLAVFTLVKIFGISRVTKLIADKAKADHAAAQNKDK